MPLKSYLMFSNTIHICTHLPSKNTRTHSPVYTWAIYQMSTGNKLVDPELPESSSNICHKGRISLCLDAARDSNGPSIGAINYVAKENIS